MGHGGERRCGEDGCVGAWQAEDSPVRRVAEKCCQKREVLRAENCQVQRASQTSRQQKTRKSDEIGPSGLPPCETERRTSEERAVHDGDEMGVVTVSDGAQASPPEILALRFSLIGPTGRRTLAASRLHRGFRIS